MKKSFIAAMVMTSSAMLTSCFSGNKTEDETASASDTSETVVSTVVEEEPASATDRIYANGFDGYVAVRATPDYKGQKLAEFRNGPEGAELLGTEGEWTKIKLNGTEGYVATKYLSARPTVAYTGDADVDWLEGIWENNYVLNIYANGTYDYGYDFSTEYGKYHLQNNEIVFEAVVVEPGYAPSDMPPLQINKAAGKIGDFSKTSFVSEQEFEENGGGAGVMTKKMFKEAAKACYKKVGEK